MARRSATPTRSSRSSPPPRWSTGGRSAPPSRAAATDEVLALTVRGADPAAVLWARTMRLRDALEAGDAPTAVEPSSDRLERLAAESRRTYYRWCLLVLQAARAIFAGRLDEGERLAEEAVELNRRHGDDADQEHTVQRLALALERRDPHDAPAGRAARLRGALPAAARCGGDARARRARARARRRGPRRGRRCSPATASPSSCARPTGCAALVLLAEPVAARGDRDAVEQLATALAPQRRPTR